MRIIVHVLSSCLATTAPAAYLVRHVERALPAEASRLSLRHVTNHNHQHTQPTDDITGAMLPVPYRLPDEYSSYYVETSPQEHRQPRHFTIHPAVER